MSNYQADGLRRLRIEEDIHVRRLDRLLHAWYQAMTLSNEWEAKIRAQRLDRLASKAWDGLQKWRRRYGMAG